MFAREAGRFPLTGKGDVNTYALFAELFLQSLSKRGRAGVILPSGIATDSTTASYFAHLTQNKRLVSLVDFENRDGLFAAVHRSFKFCVFTLGGDKVDAPIFAFFLAHPSQLAERERRFTLSPADIARINPNTNTAPIFRARNDAELTAKIYSRVPVLIRDGDPTGNPWGISFHTRIWHMAEDSEHFRTTPEPGCVPLLEAKMIHQFDHRWCTYDGRGDTRDLTATERADPAFEPHPRYWVSGRDVRERLAAMDWSQEWLLGWRDICRATDERTLIATVFPCSGSGDSILLAFPRCNPKARCAGLLASLCSTVVDYCARQKVGGTHLKLNVFKQLPVLPPEAYGSGAAFIESRVVELTYATQAMAPFARDLGYDGPPFPWNEDRRAQLRAELDAWYARAYGLTRDELRYILDPADVMGEDYPSETFRVLKNNEMKKFGEYRTRRLVLEAWDCLEAGDLK